MSHNDLKNLTANSLLSIGLFTVCFEAMVLQWKQKALEYYSERTPQERKSFLSKAKNAHSVIEHCKKVFLEKGIINKAELENLDSIRLKRNFFSHQGFKQVWSLTLDSLKSDLDFLGDLTDKISGSKISQGKKEINHKEYSYSISPCFFTHFIRSLAEGAINDFSRLEKNVSKITPNYLESLNEKFSDAKMILQSEEFIQSVEKSLLSEGNFINLTQAGRIKSDIDTIEKLPSGSGLYIFEVKQISKKKSWDDFHQSWGKIPKTSPIIKKRWRKHTFKEQQYYPFYVGKSVESLKERIKEHLFGKTSTGYLKSTSALRLHQHYSERRTADTINCFEFRVSALEIAIDPFLLPLIETKIRNRKNYIVGRDRI